MKIISDLVQRTPEWKTWRLSKITATDSPVVLGISPWKTPYELWLEKLGYGKETEINAAMQRGIDLEDHARELFEELVGVKVFPALVESDELPWAAASLDGISEDKKTLVEIKVTGDATHEQARVGLIRPNYFAQMQKQMYVTGLEKAYYFSFNGLEGFERLIWRDDNFIKNMIEKEKHFWQCVQDFEAPAACDKDFHEINSETFNNLSKEYLRIKHAKELLTMQEGDIRSQLLEYTQNGNVKNSHIKIQRIPSKGRIEYKAIPELQNVNLDMYRKSASESWRILEVG